VHDIETIDGELRPLAAVQHSIREHGGELSSRQADELLDERLAHCGRHNQDAAAAGRSVRPRRWLAAALNRGHGADAAAVVNPCANHAAKSM
jgi:hypothetical protein